jgi:hypothetical protein
MMNRLLFKRVFPQILFFAELVVLCGAIALAQDQAPVVTAPPQVAPQRTDGQIEMDVVHGLDASPELKNDLITAATIEGEVTLSGTVSSQASSDKAASIAGQVAGVTKVNNNLKIGNPQEAQGDNGVPPMAGGPAGQRAGPAGILTAGASAGSGPGALPAAAAAIPAAAV